MVKIKCAKCGYEWTPRVDNPKTCPNCKRYHIDKPKNPYTREWTPMQAFRSMKHRCYNPLDKKYSSYGGRGITICDKWLKNPVSFETWSYNNGFEPTTQIHRLDNDKGYSPENCCFLTKEEHAKRHKRIRKLKGTAKNKVLKRAFP